MKFSIVMPTFNRGYVISRAINSVIRQDYPNWELIIVNDGSTDETSSIVNKYLTDKRIKYLKEYFENRGVNHARNVAIDNANGDIITFLDSDDEYFNYTLSKAHEKISQYKDFDVYSFASVSDTGIKTCYFDKEILIPSYEEIICEKYSGDYLKFVRKNIFNEIRFDNEIKAYEGIMWKIMEKTFRPLYINIPLLIYWQDTISISRNNEMHTPAKDQNSLLALNKYLNLFGKDLKKISSKSRQVYSNQFVNIAEIYLRLNNPRTARKHLKEAIKYNPFDKRIWQSFIKSL